MLAYIKGNLELKTKDYIVIDVNGIGYKIFMPQSSIQNLGEIGEVLKVHTYMRVREDDVSIFGFINNEELRLFELLLSVGGIGAKVGLTILSNITPSQFALAVISNDISILKKLPGIGPKTAQRIILELKDKLKKEKEILAEEEKEEGTPKLEIVEDENVEEAISALQVLGYSKREVVEALAKVEINNLSVEDIIRKALGNLAKGL